MRRPIKKYALGQQVVARPSAGTISDVYVGAYDGWNKNAGNGALLQGIGAGFGALQGSAVMANKDAAMRASADTQRSINNQTGNYDVGMQNMQAQQGRFILKKGKKSMNSMVPGEVEQGEYIIDYDQHGEPYVYSDLDHPMINKHEDPGGGPVMNIPEGATIVPAKYADKMRRIINGNSITDINEFKRIRDTLPEYGCGTKTMRKYEQGIQDVATGTPLTDPKAIQNQWMYGTQPTNDFEMPFQNIGKQKLPNETSDVYNHNNFMMAPQTPLQPAPPPKQNRLTNLLDNTVKEARASKAIFPYPTIMDPTYASMNRMKTMNEQVYRNEYKDGVQFYQDGTA